MTKGKCHWLTLLLSITVVFLPNCLVADEDWSFGCYKEDIHNPAFQVSAGNYKYKLNLTGSSCVEACSLLNSSYKLAGLTANSICLCSSLNLNSLHNVSDVLCMHPSDEALYIKVFPIAPLANITAPGNVSVFEEFRVNISTTADVSCSYVIHFDDCSHVNVTRNTSFVTHRYKGLGSYRIKLTAAAACLPRAITADVEVKRPYFGNSSLHCPDFLEITQTDSSCVVSVSQGTDINVSLNSSGLGTMADTAVRSLGICLSPFYTDVGMSSSSKPSGVYLMMSEGVSYDGVIQALELNVYKPGNLKIQAYAPVCPTSQVPCHGRCVTAYSKCLGPGISITPVDYKVRSEVEVNITSKGYIFKQLSSALSVKRGDIIGWHSPDSSIEIYFSNNDSSSVLFYSNQLFNGSDTVPKTFAKRLNRTYHFRAYQATTSMFSFGVTPIFPRLEIKVNVSSELTGLHKQLSKVIQVQERISGLQLLSPSVSRYYPTFKEISFHFEVASGSDTIYHLVPGDNTTTMTCDANNCSHSYQERDNYTLGVTASNLINNVSLQETVALVGDVANLTFINNPEDYPGETSVPYNVTFRLGRGDGVMIRIDFGENVSLFMSCDNIVNQQMTVNFTYSKSGTYNITVIAYSTYFRTNVNVTSAVEILKRIKNLTLYQIDIDVVKLLNVEISNYMPSQNLTIRACVTSGSNVTFDFVASGSDVKSWKISNNEATFEFSSGGVRNIAVTARNRISQLQRTVRVTVVVPCESRVSLFDNRSESEPLRMTRGNDIKIRVEVSPPVSSISCNETFSSCWRYNWTLFVKVGQEYSLHNSAFNRSRDIFFVEKNTLSAGLYKVHMFASCDVIRHFNNVRKQTTYFQIEESDPVALIEGGARRDVAFDATKPLKLDGRSSYDPDGTLFDSAGLTFSWSCLDSSLDLQGERSALLEVNMTKLAVGTSYTFQINVTKSGNKSAESRQQINIVDESVPTTEIRCQVNCLPFVIVTERLSLEGRCLNCQSQKDIEFSWRLQEKINDNWTDVTLLENKTFTGWQSENLVIKPNFFNQSKQYKLRLEAKRKDCKNGSLSTYIFNTSGAPNNGTCEINPGTGVAASTNFRVKCQGWKTSHVPLTYLIRYQSSFTLDSDVSSVDSKDDRIWILWYHGKEQTSPSSTLPSGLEPNYTLDVQVRIQDKYGAYSTSHLSVKVKPPNLTDAEIKNGLNDVNPKEQPQKLTQLVTTYSTDLNNGHTVTGVSVEELRLHMVEKLSDINADTLPLIKQTTDALKLATYDSKQVPHKTQDVAATKLEKMSDTLFTIASTPERRDGQIIDETARILLSGLSKILNASFFTGKDMTKKNALKEVKPNLYGTVSKKGEQLQKIGDDTKNVVSKLVEIIGKIGVAILKKKLIGENPTLTQTGYFQMKLSKSLPRHLDKLTQINNKIGRFVIPSRNITFVNRNDDQLYTELIAFHKNPFSWDIEQSHFIQPNVLSLSFKTENDTIPVHNLSSDIEIYLFNKDRPRQRFLFRPSYDDPTFLVYNFRVRESHFQESILIDIQGSRELSGETFFIRFGDQVTKSSFHFSHQLSNRCLNCEGRSIDVVNGTVLVHDHEKLKMNFGQVSIGVLLCPPDKGVQQCAVSSENYTVYVHSVSCRYWNKTQWMRDGCRVGPQTTPEQTHCLCNHLTSFSSYIVEPNPLTKFSVEDFKEGYVTFVSVLVIFLLYLLVLVWARKADRADTTKVGVCALVDNNSQDRYRYEIAIWTGMRRNAGTESEVTVILSGDLLDSEPRRLVNPNTKSYSRGSIEKFLLTTPHDLGSLYCIRIWHDNSKGSWYLSRVMVTDLEKDERYYFICDRWLAVDEDDGAVERLLPVASDEELIEFHRLFFSRTKRDLSDSHLWVSVFNRPPQSLFTRVQRLSCCLCLLMMTMATNAMFYEARSEPKPNSTNFIGSYSFTWDEVFIGVVSSLIIFPVNVIILNIFRRVRPKPGKRRRQSKLPLDRLSPDYHGTDKKSSLTPSLETLVRNMGNHDDENQSSTNTGPDQKKNKQGKRSTVIGRCLSFLPSSLPHGFVYFAWFLVVILTLGSATVVILYGMQFGNGRSLKWLFSIVVSIAEDIFLLQPLKVLFLALAFALLVKKPDEGEFKISASEALQDDEEYLVNPPADSGQENRVTSPSFATRPDESQLKVMRKARLKERKMLGLIQEIIVHLLFTIVIALVTYGHKDSRAIYLSRNLERLAASTSKIVNFPGVWNWSRGSLIPKTLPAKLYNSEDVPSYGFLDDRDNKLISRARMRLLRVKRESCTIPEELKQIIDFCAKGYSIFDQDEACYDERWTKTSCKINNISPWYYQSWRRLDGYPLWGRFTTYSGGGYVTELTPGENNNDTANEMETHRWLERQSRALFVEFTTYNANVNLYASIRLLFEFPSYGGVFFSRYIQPMRLKVYVGGFAFFIFACEVIFLVFTTGYLYSALKKLYRNGVGYFKNFWNIVDFTILVVAFCAIGVYVYRIEMTTKLMKRVRELDGAFVNFQYVTYWNQVFNSIIALVISLTTLKLTKLMRFNLRVSLFAKTLQYARPALVMFAMQFSIVFFAYAMVGVLVFGYNVARFKSILSSMMSLGRVILGKSQFTELSSIDPVIGPLFFFTFVLMVCWILFTMFMAILIDAYHEVQVQCGTMSNDYEMVDFFVARFRAWFGFQKAKEQVSPLRRWRRARMKMNAAKTFGTGHVYQPSAEHIALEKTGDLMEKLEHSLGCLEKRVDLLALDGEQ